MNAARRQFLDWTDCLLDPDATPHAQREAAQAWCHWGLQLLGIDAANPGAGVFSTPTQLSTGTAIAPGRAAQCIWETRRTTVFLQAMAAALREARARFPHEPLHVVEARSRRPRPGHQESVGDALVKVSGRGVDDGQELRADPLQAVVQVGGHRRPAVDVDSVVRAGVGRRVGDLHRDGGQGHASGAAGDRFLPVDVLA